MLWLKISFSLSLKNLSLVIATIFSYVSNEEEIKEIKVTSKVFLGDTPIGIFLALKERKTFYYTQMLIPDPHAIN